MRSNEVKNDEARRKDKQKTYYVVFPEFVSCATEKSNYVFPHRRKWKYNLYENV